MKLDRALRFLENVKIQAECVPMRRFAGSTGRCAQGEWFLLLVSGLLGFNLEDLEMVNVKWKLELGVWTGISDKEGDLMGFHGKEFWGDGN